ncbi:uncharacterized protein LOC143196101 isoform X1 [Rhynchophorus ferrugineus]|uniref:uncharacterized protein LOC143196101 isoform X1 n=1 Tax=Rhynchophorus ferrugineus TaxID=354439 RepID=UPI003FCD321F
MKFSLIVGLLFYVNLASADTTKDEGLSTTAVVEDDDSDMYMEPLEEDHEAAPSSFQGDIGNWYPSFSRSFDTYSHQPSGHSRPFFYSTYQQQEGAYSQRNEPPFQQNVAYNQEAKLSGYKGFKPKEETASVPSSDKSASILGDGNFGVIQGGTFYAEKSNYDSESDFDDFSSYFRNGHGRPSYFYPNNPKPGQHAQFENFKDFADINTPSDRQYSQYVVVYTNKNGTRTSTVTKPETPSESARPSESNEPEFNKNRPRNILESLAMLDSVDSMKRLTEPSYDQGDVIDISPEKKMSKSKTKLSKLLPEKKHKAKLLQKEKDMGEPLLALS